MSLFLKIFLWFWGAMTILGLALVAVQFTTQDDLVIPPQRGMMMDALANYGIEAVKAYESGGDKKLASYLSTVEKRKRVRVFLFSPSGEELGGQKRATSDIKDLSRKAETSFLPQFELSTFRVMAAQPVLSGRGTYVFAGAVSRTLLAARRTDPETKVIGFLVVVLTTGAFCYGLARYLAMPVGRIRRAAQQLAAGELSARVERNHIPRGNDEISGLARDFDTMAERLQNLVTAQNRLLGDVSHELRSPLARLNLALELARRGDETKREAAFGRIERESIRLDALIGELLTLSRLENGLKPEKLQNPVDLAVLAREVVEDAAWEAQNAGRGVKVVYNGPDEEICVRGDAELLWRAVENVTRNALAHTDDNSVVELDLSRSNGSVTLSVSDQGPGVPDEDLNSIFRPFFRVDGARERRDGGQGTGLGLAIAERALSAHGGHISAKNRADGGLSVALQLPDGSARKDKE